MAFGLPPKQKIISLLCLSCKPNRVSSVLTCVKLEKVLNNYSEIFKISFIEKTEEKCSEFCFHEMLGITFDRYHFIFCHLFCQVDSLVQMFNIFKSPDTEDSLRKSSADQLAIILQGRKLMRLSLLLKLVNNKYYSIPNFPNNKRKNTLQRLKNGVHWFNSYLQCSLSYLNMEIGILFYVSGNGHACHGL